MRDLLESVGDPQLLVDLEPEELATKILFILRRRRERNFVLQNLLAEFTYGDPFSGQPHVSGSIVSEIKVAVAEAWSWLQAQGLLVTDPEQHGNYGHVILSRRARQFESESAFAHHKVARLLPKDVLHRRFADRVWSAFIRGEFDAAVFQATKAVEVYVREASGLGHDLIGTKLMQEAFKPENGLLTDSHAESGERLARMQLFCGALGSYKNPNSHRDVNMSDPVEALEIIMLANHLMKIIDARVAVAGEQKSNPC